MKSRAKRLEESKSIPAIVDSVENRLLTKSEDVKIIYGKRSVLLYSDASELGSPYLFLFDSGDASFVPCLGEVTRVRLEGKWTLR